MHNVAQLDISGKMELGGREESPLLLLLYNPSLIYSEHFTDALVQARRQIDPLP